MMIPSDNCGCRPWFVSPVLGNYGVSRLRRLLGSLSQADAEQLGNVGVQGPRDKVMMSVGLLVIMRYQIGGRA